MNVSRMPIKIGLSPSKIVHGFGCFFPKPHMSNVIIEILPDMSSMTCTVSSRLAMDSASSITLPCTPILLLARRIARLFVAQRFFLRRYHQLIAVRPTKIPHFGITSQMLTDESPQHSNFQVFHIPKAYPDSIRQARRYPSFIIIESEMGSAPWPCTTILALSAMAIRMSPACHCRPCRPLLFGQASALLR